MQATKRARRERQVTRANRPVPRSIARTVETLESLLARVGESSGIVTKYGTDREVGFARVLLAKLAERLAVVGDIAATWHPKLLASTDALEGASDERKNAVVAMGPLLTAQYLYVEDVNLELDRVEGQLQQIFPGDAKRVASYLVATRRDDAGVPDAAPTPPDTTGTPHG